MINNPNNFFKNINKKQVKIPQLRFPEFTKEWKKFNLEDFSIIKDGTHKSHKNVENGIYLLSAKNIINGKIIIPESSRKISKIDYDKIHTNYVLENGDILYTIVGSIGNIAIIENYDGSYTFQRSVAIIKTDEYSPFIKYLLQIPSFKKQIKIKTNSSAQSGIYLGELSKIECYIPSKEEEKEIGNFLDSIDKQISFLEHEESLYDKLIESTIQMIFSNEEKFFSYKIKNIPLKEVVTIPKKEKVTNLENKKRIKVKLHCKGIELNNHITKKSYFERFTNELLISRQNFHKGGIAIVPKNMDGCICSNAIISLKIDDSKINLDYLYDYLSQKSYYKKSEKITEGTSQKEWSEKEILNLKIKVPSLKDQEKIVVILKSFYDKIKLCKIKKDKMKLFKLSLLQKMFI